jgi:hypothetical protein
MIIKNRLALYLYVIIILLFALFAAKRPLYNWDTLAYMAVALHYDHHSTAFVHDTIYAIAKQQMPSASYNELTDGGLEYRKTMAGNALAFDQQMPFYTVKPLYTGLVYILYKVGVPLLEATVLPSLIFYVLIGILLMIWIAKYLNFLPGMLVCLLLMMIAPMWEIARCSSPDAVSAFFVLTSLYFLLEKESLVLTFVFLMGAVLSRLDNILPAFLIISLAALSSKWTYKISFHAYGLMLLCMALIYFCITWTTRSYGWNAWYYPTFISSLNTSYSFHPTFRWNDYRSLVVSHLVTGLFFSYLALFMALASFLFIGKPPFRFRDLTFDQQFIGTIVVAIVIRFVLQPVVADRFYIAYYLCILILLIRKCKTGPIWTRPSY